MSASQYPELAAGAEACGAATGAAVEGAAVMSTRSAKSSALVLKATMIAMCVLFLGNRKD